MVRTRSETKCCSLPGGRAVRCSPLPISGPSAHHRRQEFLHGFPDCGSGNGGSGNGDGNGDGNGHGNGDSDGRTVDVSDSSDGSVSNDSSLRGSSSDGSSSGSSSSDGSSSGGLAFTGLNVIVPLGVGAALLLVGGGLAVAGNRRKRNKTRV